MMSLNPFVENNKTRMNAFLNALCDVGDFYETLEMDQYMALSKKDLQINITLNDGTAMQDRIPADGFFILCLGRGKEDATTLAKAIEARKAPVSVLEIPDKIARDIYGFDMLLLRPDMHVVWRGNAAPRGRCENAAGESRTRVRR